jgi:paraquat-inducible protein B
MKKKFNPTVVGAFVLGALALTVGGIIAFGSSHWFSKPARFTAFFNESVQGLEIGSAVKLRGVRVGQVAEIGVDYDPQSRKSKVAVVCEMENNRITDNLGRVIKITETDALKKLIREGLYAKMRLTGITGMQIIELDFADPQKTPVAAIPQNQGRSVVMPTVASGFTEFADTASEILKSLKEMKLGALTTDLQLLITNVNTKITSMDLERMVTRVAAAAEAFEKLVGGAHSSGVVTNINEAVTQVRTLATSLDSEVISLGAEAKETLAKFSRAAEAVQKTLGPDAGLGDSAVKALKQLEEAAASIQRLADYLERNPNAIISGKKQPGNDR